MEKYSKGENDILSHKFVRGLAVDEFGRDWPRFWRKQTTITVSLLHSPGAFQNSNIH